MVLQPSFLFRTVNITTTRLGSVAFIVLFLFAFVPTSTTAVCLFLVHTLAELKMTGNCLKGSRPLLSFDPVRKHYY